LIFLELYFVQQQLVSTMT